MKIISEKAEIAEHKMEESQNSANGEMGKNVSREAMPWYYTASLLEKKAVSQRKKGDLDGAIGSTRLVVELRREHLRRKEIGKRDASKPQQQLARALVYMGSLLVLKEQKAEAAKAYKEALQIYKSYEKPSKQISNLIRDVQAELDKLGTRKELVPLELKRLASF